MKKFLTKKYLILFLIVLAVGGWFRYIKYKSDNKKRNEEKIVEVQKRDVISTLILSGEIKAERQVILNFPSSGKLAHVYVKEGDQVKKGQLLAAMDLGDLRASESKAYYLYLSADAYAKKIEDEVKNHDSDETFTQKYNRVSAQTSRDMAYDVWLTAKRAVDNAVLKSPFNGIVTNITANVVGDTVSITDGMTIIDPGALYFEAEIDETDLYKFDNNAEVSIILDAYGENKFIGTITNIGFTSQISSSGATVYPVKINFVDTDQMKKLRLGMNGDAQIRLDIRRAVLALPFDAVVEGEVMIKNGEVKTLKVETGLVGDDYVEIKSGLKEGDTVIVQ